MSTKTRFTRRQRIAQMPSRELHAIVGQFDLERRSADLSERQEWLYDYVVMVLERRHRDEPRLLARCWCRYCVNPFDPQEDRGAL